MNEHPDPGATGPASLCAGAAGSAAQQADGKAGTARLDGRYCVNTYDVYHNLNTGKYVKEVSVGQTCHDSGGGTGSENPEPVDTQTLVSNLPPCADNVLSNLLKSAVTGGTSGNLIEAILAAIGSNSSTRVKVVSVSLPDKPNGALVAGNCEFKGPRNGVNNFTIQINQKLLSGPATNLFIAQVLIHEMLHAGLMDWRLNHGSSVNGVSFDDALNDWMSAQAIVPGDNAGQHDAMSFLVDQLGQALYDYHTSIDRSNQNIQPIQFTSLQDCKDLSWSGLEGSAGYQYAVSHITGFYERFVAIQGAEFRGQWTAAGSQANGTFHERYPAGKDPCQ